AAVGGCLAGLLGAVLPGWWAGGSLQAGLLAASFPNSIPTLAPFAAALLASSAISLLLVWISSAAGRGRAA
ncbi:MAG: sodium:solute symporter, partial [Betaproteobacteria bacterium]|nr:sodium:solute symporter [Betaproteobacteria bacterium]